MHEYNVQRKIAKIRDLLGGWHARGLTIAGKIMVLKVLGLSQITYQMINVHIPKKYLKELDNIVWTFVWNGTQRAKVRRMVMIQDYDLGGMKVPDVFSIVKALKVKWIERLQEQTIANGE